jgi:primosomal replication protein N
LNRIVLTARLVQRQALRYTPAGVAVIEAEFSHEGDVIEAGVERHVRVDVDTVAVGALAQRLEALALGASAKLTGFIAHRSRRSRKLRIHITDFELGE